MNMKFYPAILMGDQWTISKQLSILRKLKFDAVVNLSRGYQGNFFFEFGRENSHVTSFNQMSSFSNIIKTFFK